MMGEYDAGYENCIDSMVRQMEDMQFRIDNLHRENAKLRELVCTMAYCMQYERECDGCRLNGADGAITEHAGCDGLRELMRELGVEVDG